MSAILRVIEVVSAFLMAAYLIGRVVWPLIRRAKWLPVIIVLCIPQMAWPAGRVFYDGFEDGTTNAWVADGTRNKCTAVSSALDAGVGPYAGTKMAQCNWDGTVGFSDPESYRTLKLNSWSYTEEMFVRARFRYDADVDQVNGGKAMRLEDGTNGMYWGVDMSSPTDDVTAYWEFIDGVQSPGSYVYWGNGENIGDGQWHEIEIYILARTNTTGIFRIWVDGTLVKELTGIKTTGPTSHWYPMYVMSNWSSNPGWEHDANNHVYWDEMEIYSDTGAGATGSMSDATITQGSGSIVLFSRSIVIFVEWVPFALGVLFHFRQHVVAAGLAMASVCSMATAHISQRTYHAATYVAEKYLDYSKRV